MEIKIVLFVILSLSLAIVGCSSSTTLASGASQSGDDPAPSLAFQRYWDSARERNQGQVDDLTIAPPERFYLCQSISRAECDKKLSDNNNRRIDSESRGIKISRFEIETDYSMIRVNVPSGIANGFWASYVIKSEDVVENEARLSVAVTIKDYRAPIIREVLLYRTEAGWKIFAIEDPGAYEFFASK